MAMACFASHLQQLTTTEGSKRPRVMLNDRLQDGNGPGTAAASRALNAEADIFN